MKNINFLITLFSIFIGLRAQAAAPTIDSFNVQSYIRLTNLSPVSNTSANFVFAIFKGSTCIWAKRYLSVALNAGMMNQKISGLGTNVTAISNSNVTPGECVANFSAITLNSTLLAAGAVGALNIRVYSETNLDGYLPIWDVSIASAPTAFVADYASTAESAILANDLVVAKKVTNSAGAADAGKFPMLDSNGKLDNSAINNSALAISYTQVSGLGTAATANTGTASGNVPSLDVSGRLTAGVMPAYTANRVVTTDASGNLIATLSGVNTSAGASDAGKVALLNAAGKVNANMLDMPTYTANRVMATNGSGVMSGSYAATNTSAGAADAGKIALLNVSGKFSNTMIDSSLLTPTLANTTGTLAVNRGGTGATTLSAGSLLVGNGTSAVQTLPPTNGNVLVGAAGLWSSSTPDSAGLVDQASNQTIAGNKTWNGAQTINGTFTLGNGGSTFTKIIRCTIASSAQSSGTDKSVACAGIGPTSIVACSPTDPVAIGWSIAAAWPEANTIYVRPYRYSGLLSWTTGFNCVAYIP